VNYELIFGGILILFIGWLIYRSFGILQEGLRQNRIGKIVFLVAAFCIVGFFLIMGTMGIISGWANS
jgi:hypothetical protein